jgi:hypothetical protein
MLIYPFNITDREEKVWAQIGDKSVRIVDCDLFPKRKEIKEIINKVYSAILDEGYLISRSEKDMCGELYLHVICAKLGIAVESAKHADLEYDKDSRWYVRFCSKILSILF